VLLAKQNEVPIVALSAITQREHRGSFLIDNIPTVQYRHNQPKVSIVLAINRLIDEVLKFVLWHESMSSLAERSFDWYSATTPEYGHIEYEHYETRQIGATESRLVLDHSS